MQSVFSIFCQFIVLSDPFLGFLFQLDRDRNSLGIPNFNWHSVSQVPLEPGLIFWIKPLWTLKPARRQIWFLTGTKPIRMFSSRHFNQMPGVRGNELAE